MTIRTATALLVDLALADEAVVVVDRVPEVVNLVRSPRRPPSSTPRWVRSLVTF